MCRMYNRLKALCDEKGITGYKMCKDTGMQPSIMTDLKAGRKHTLSAKSMAKVADYFGVTIEYLMSGEPDSKDYVERLLSKETSVEKNIDFESVAQGILFKATEGATEEELLQTAKYLNFLKGTRKE